MPQLAPITLINKGTNTLTFKPKKIDNNGVASLICRGTQPGVYHSMSLSLVGDETNGHNGVIRIGVPSVYTIPGSGEQVIAADFVEVKIKLAALGTAESRTEAVTLLKSALTDANILSMLTQLEAFY
jgi:hypothetical protein